MKHIFLMNPAAGKGGRAVDKLLSEIDKVGKEKGYDYEIYKTRCAGDAENYVRQRCLEQSGKLIKDKIRFYAMGGDGTLNEAANGAAGCDFAEITVIPCGTGNDFVRNFPRPVDFLNIEKQFKGTSEKIDLIRYNERYAVNMINVGADCDVVIEAGKMKKKPFISGPAAYAAGALKVLSGKIGIKMSVNTETEDFWEDELILIAIANGKFCGGGFKGVPNASVNDGLIDVSLVKMIPKRKFLGLLPKYKKGTHLDSRKDAEFFKCLKCRNVSINPEEMIEASVDGEIVKLGKTDFSIVHNAINFSIPENQRG